MFIGIVSFHTVKLLPPPFHCLQGPSEGFLGAGPKPLWREGWGDAAVFSRLVLVL